MNKLVKAAAGLKIPKEGKPQDYITDQEIVAVPEDSAYYIRRLIDGDLVEATQEDYDKQLAEIAKAEKAAEKAATKAA